MIKQYRKLPMLCDVLLFDGGNHRECGNFIGKSNFDNTLDYPHIKTLEGIMEVSIGDYIVKGIHGECWPVKPEIFSKTYEEVL